ncbi:hypothetical protein SNE40_020397 [Patella caerulea]|uniref:Transposase n=1 Tax=Patella caerulea TaxID=87958 RepID=A0AAN8G7G1_PATCE
MEKEGLIRAVRWLQENNVQLDTLITDRHLQIGKWICENLDNTKHFFDVWHVAKGLKKKMVGLGKEKDCESINPYESPVLVCCIQRRRRIDAVG